MNEIDVKAIIASEIKKFVNDTLDKEIKKILHSNNTSSRDELITIIKNAMESVYKVLWSQRNFWKDSIK